MRILMFVPLFYPHIGGVEKHVRRLSEELVKRENEVTVVTLKYEWALTDSEEVERIRICRLPKTSLLRIWLWIWKHRGLVKRADIIQCHDFGTFIYWFLPFRFLYPMKRVYITFHGHEGIIPIPARIMLLRKATERLTKANICIGKYIWKWYGTKAGFISYGGVDPICLENASDGEGAVFIGRLERDTGIVTYVDGIRILRKKYNTNLPLSICGDGSLRKAIEQMTERHKLSVEIHGAVSDPLSYLRKTKFAFVSGYLAILEAMISRKLVFAAYENELKRDYLASIPGSEDMMVIVPSPEALAKEILYHLENPGEAKGKLEKAYSFAKEQTWAKVTEMYLRMWDTKDEKH